MSFPSPVVYTASMAKVRTPADPNQFTEAIDWFRKRVPMTDAAFQQLTDFEQQFAFRVANLNQARLVGDVFSGIDSAIANGDSFTTFKKKIGPTLQRAWGVASSPQVETTFRNNVLGAYNAGRQVIMDDEEVREQNPKIRFDGIDDSRITDICEQRDGIVLPANDPFWKTNTPPLHHNCRSILVPEDEDTPTNRKSVSTKPTAGFGTKPIDVNPTFDIDFSKMPGQVGKELRKKLRDSP